jgi:phosphoribosylformylglycinamidine synthase PurS subunit
MSFKAQVVVMPKPAINDPQGGSIKRGLGGLGFGEVTEVRMGKYIEITLSEQSEERARDRIGQMCHRLLANQVIEDFRFDLVADKGAVVAVGELEK